ncbi:TonB-dependent receptor plug domain-containing protein [Aquabacterium sp. OR-4]|uniref:TonB-dependent receptor plug domain-containing protein n=1 Tax=Aquabacterium sp. OR-4 TaxID=2978127 RepID=UPI0028C9834D|nr:TonB-dependent receptor [Aquabacterium sp. OR-4]MDT7837375.1 TonB-dependent receptor [Aquabacterium sp. OR-4]
MNPALTHRPQRLSLAVAAALGSLSALWTPPLAAQASASAAPADERVVIVGSRRAAPVSTALDTTVPVDLYSLGRTAESGGQFDLAQSLQYLSPSFNSTRQTGADGADLVDSAALRGLGSDQTLVLVNGKRRHTVALVNLFGARNRGNTGTDMNALPLLAIDNLQVLRDGAAAQYGSDAIAGVINVALKKRVGCEGVAAAGQYSAGDGRNGLVSAYCGWKLGAGTLAITGEWQDRGRSNRAEADSPRTIGDSQVRNQTLYLNGEWPTGGDARLYTTLGLQQRRASSAAWARGGVGSDDIPSRNSAAMYPDGFVPYINADIDDRWGTLGWKAGVGGGWTLDLSQTHGFNEMRYDISRTLNASIANLDLLNGGAGLSPSRFDAGGFSFRQDTSNLDVSRYFDGVLGGTNLAFGAEYRREQYRIVAGEAGSYNDVDGVGFGGNAGSQGFPGFQPGDATRKRRSSRALYLELESTPTAALTTQAALRHERYSDFGATTTGKLAGAWKLGPAALLRGSASSGFRAPSLQQVFFSSTFTDFINGNPMDVVLAPNGGAVANAAGIPKLKQERSKHFTLGGSLKPAPGWTFTADLYHIDIRDRIVLSGRFDDSNYPALGSLLASLGVGQAQFFVNSVDTRTQGIDLTAAHTLKLAGGQLDTRLALNKGRTRVTGVHAPASLVGFEDVLLSERERLFIEQGAPSLKATLGFEYQQGAWTTDFKIIHFGSQTLGTFSGTAAGVPNARYAPRTSADLSVSTALAKNVRITVGGNNIFNVKPSTQDANETDNGFKYDSVQFGLSGASYFAKLHVMF